MGITENIKNISGIVTVQIEGFFTERFINLCKINNINIWDVRNIVKGVVRFKIRIRDFKKLRKIARKTKCKVKIKEKRRLYFKLFKYRKRKTFLILITLLFMFAIAFSTYVWNINIEGNNTIDEDLIISKLKESELYKGKNKIGLDKKEIVNSLRVLLPDAAWVGLEIDGTTATVKIVEKVNLDDKYVQNTVPGDIVANKNGIITKIVVENGTALLKEGSYVENGNIVIEGVMYSKILEPTLVPAKGVVLINSNNEFKKEYKYEEIVKNYTGKKRYTIGITINSKENMLNYLNKDKKYDITKNSKTFNLFGNVISLDFYECNEYTETIVTRTKEELVDIATKESKEYINTQVIPNLKNAKLVSEDYIVEDIQDGISFTNKYVINEEIGIFRER